MLRRMRREKLLSGEGLQLEELESDGLLSAVSYLGAVRAGA